MLAIDKSLAPHPDSLRTHFPKDLGDAANLSVEALSGDASSRRYYRIHADTHRYVLQVDQAFEKKNEDSHAYISALKLFHRLKMPVPNFCGSSAENGWILMQDLGDVTLQQRPDDALYREAIDLLVRLTCEAEIFRGQKFDESYLGPHFGWAFDEVKLGQEMAYTAKHLVASYYGEDPNRYMELAKPTVQYLDRAPRFFCHRDYHCRNLMVHDEKLWVIDFQDARLGPLSYDLVSILWDPYVQIPDAFRKELKARWLEGLKSLASQKSLNTVLDRVSSSELGAEIERMKLQRLLKAAGSYASFYFLKGRKDYLPSIDPALRSAIEALKTLLGNPKQARSEDEGLLTLLEGFLSRDSAIIERR